MVTDPDSASSTNVVDVIDYTYNDSGIRIEKYSFKVAQNYLDTADEQTNATDQVTTTYLIDSYNHTGYAQVLEEWMVDGTDATLVTYTLGDNVIAQTKSNWEFTTQWDPVGAAVTQYMLYDGHGSTRQLIDNTGLPTGIDDSLSYDAYGIMLDSKFVVM